MPTMIDPPSGWQYGFPKVLPEGITDVKKWLIEQGYPKEIIKEMGDYFYCRYWGENLPDRRVMDMIEEEDNEN